tara:strand:+ start:431 stop:955 length:525 start_codon:yes stop_codon:yes gene_type:complete
MTNSKFVFLIILIGLVSSLAGLYLGKNTLFFNNATQTEVFFNSQSKDLNNNNVSLSQYKNKWMLVNFWATWCAPCRDEIPELNDLAKNNNKVQLVGIAIDEIEAVKIFLGKTPIHYDSYISNDMDGLEISKSLGNEKGILPFTVLIAPSGKIQEAFYGRLDVSSLNKYLIKIIE